jgi:hypothetical protein
MQHVLKSGATALAAATLVLTAAGTAHAESATVNDRTGDVWRVPLAESGSFSEVGSTLNGDIDRTVVDHSTDTLTITTTFARMARKKVAFQPYYVIRTDSGGEYLAAAYAGPREWDGEHMLDGISASPRTLPSLRGVPPTEEESCADMTHRFSYRKDTATVEIPRSCVGDAAWVKVKSLAISAKPRGERLLVDNGHIRGHAYRGWTGQVDAEAAPID